MNSTLTQIVAGIIAAVVPVIVKLVNDWAEAHKAPAAATASTNSAPPQEISSDKLS